MSSASVATYNAHGSMDGWGRPFDLVAACAELDSDVLVLEEVLAPLEGPSQAEEVAAALGYEALDLPLARAFRLRQPLAKGRGWGPHRPFSTRRRPLVIGTHTDAVHQADGYEEVTWGLAVLSRLEVVSSRELELGSLAGDVTRRGALVTEIGAPGTAARSGVPGAHAGGGHGTRHGARPLVVVGTHAAHLTDGSPLHFAKLRRELRKLSPPVVLAGDMNLWGPPLELFFGGFRRAVRGATWPATLPHSQLDHILVTGEIETISGRVVACGGSDHRAVRAEIAWG